MARQCPEHQAVELLRRSRGPEAEAELTEPAGLRRDAALLVSPGLTRVQVMDDLGRARERGPRRKGSNTMTLTCGRFPSGHQRGSCNLGALPDHIADAGPWPRRVHATFGNRTVLDSRNGMMLRRTGTGPALLFPLGDLTADVLVEDEPPGSRTVRAGNRPASRAVTAAPALEGPAGAGIKGLVIIGCSATDRWFEGDDPLHARPRDPYHRVDARLSSPHAVARHAGVVIADSGRPELLFETGLPAQHYLLFADVRTGLPGHNGTISQCPHKGGGQHRNLAGAGEVMPDAAWRLPHQLAEVSLAFEHVSSYPASST